MEKKEGVKFSELGLNEQVLEAIGYMGFEKASPIQEQSIPAILKNQDVLAFAQTGTGKTAAFVLPILHKLAENPSDNIDTVIICPTRELAMQVFEVLRTISDMHELSIGLIIGGKSLEVEQKLIYRMNIVVCTPGRILQHMQESIGFNFKNLRHLVIDEADEIINMGYLNTLNSIVDMLPTKRQTVLISATLGKNVMGLGKIAL